MFDDSAENIADTSKALAQQNIPRARQNTIQAKFLSHTEIICYKIPISDSENFATVLDTLATFTSIKSFNFSAIIAAFFNSSACSTINFIPSRSLKPAALIEVFEHCNIPYLLTHSSLVFQATTKKLKKLFLPH